MAASPKRRIGSHLPRSAAGGSGYSGTRQALTAEGDAVAWNSLAGPTFDQLLALKPPLAIRLRVMFDVVLALDAVHANTELPPHQRFQGHVCPADVLVGLNGVSSVATVPRDYRRSKLPAQPRRGYLAPELLLRKYTGSAKTDVFSAGVMLWESLTEQRLFSENKAQKLFEQIRSHELPEPGQLPSEAWALLMIAEKAFTYHPKDRYTDAKELMADMFQASAALLATHEQVSAWVLEHWKLEVEYAGLDSLPDSEESVDGPGQPVTALSSLCAGEVHATPLKLPGPPGLPSAEVLAELLPTSGPDSGQSDHPPYSEPSARARLGQELLDQELTQSATRKAYRPNRDRADSSVPTPRLHNIPSPSRATLPGAEVERPPVAGERPSDAAHNFQDRPSKIPTLVPPALTQAELRERSSARATEPESRERAENAATTKPPPRAPRAEAEAPLGSTPRAPSIDAPDAGPITESALEPTADSDAHAAATKISQRSDLLHGADTGDALSNQSSTYEIHTDEIQFADGRKKSPLLATLALLVTALLGLAVGWLMTQ